MKFKAFLKRIGFSLFFGLCITLLSGRAAAFAGGNDAKLNVTDVSIIKEGSYRLKVYNLTESQTVMYRSGDAQVASVSKTGMVKGLSYGSTVVTATIVEEGNAVATLQCNVIIGPAAVSIKLTKTSLVLMTGTQKRLYANVLPLNTVEKPVFYSTDTEIAKVSSAGRVRAAQPGSAQIFAFLENGQSSTCDVTVLDEADYAKYLEGKTIEEIMAEDAEDTETEPVEDENSEVIESDEEDKEKNKDVVTEDKAETAEKSEKSEKTEKSDKTENNEKTADRDGSAAKNVQDAPKAVGEK